MTLKVNAMKELGFLCAFLVCLNLTVAKQCIFPKEMYISDAAEKHWRILSRDQAVSTYHKFRRLLFSVSEVFTEEYMATHTSKEPVFTKTYRCLNSQPDDKYLLEVENSNAVKKFMCIQFLVRHLNVVQWKVSDHATEQDDTLCQDDNLTLVDSPLIYYYKAGYWRAPRNKHLKYEPFPLSGGYLMTWKVSGTNGMCEGEIPPLKLENECKKGEGLRFLVPHDAGKCNGVDKAMMNKQFLTLASWTEGDYKFSIIVEPQDEWKYVLCFRTPKDAKDDFDAHIFMDTICDSTEELSNSHDIRKLHLNRYPVRNVCADETHSCGRFAKDASSCDFADAEVCRASCDVCKQDSEIGDPDLTFDKDYEGIWLKNAQRSGEEEVIIEDRLISFESIGDFKPITLANCDDSIDESSTGESKEYFLLSTFSNGCSPRMSRMVIANRSSNVISVRISQSKIVDLSVDFDSNKMKWFFNNDDWDQMCRHLSYDGDIDPIYDSYRPYSNGWFNMVLVDSEDLVPCKFPFNDTLRAFSMQSQDGTDMTGEVTTNNPNKITVTVTSHSIVTSSPWPYVESDLTGKTFEFSCVANFPGDNADQRNMVITTTPTVSQGLVENSEICWLFLHDKQIAYWMPISDCDVNTEFHIEAMFKTPLATLKFTSCASFVKMSVINVFFIIFINNFM